MNDRHRHGWNEIVVDGRGNIYLNSICFGFMAGEEPRPGIIALVTPDGEVRRVADGMKLPNGMVVTPDNSTLIVSESFAGRLTAFDIDGEGGGGRRQRRRRDRPPDGPRPASPTLRHQASVGREVAGRGLTVVAHRSSGTISRTSRKERRGDHRQRS